MKFILTALLGISLFSITALASNTTNIVTAKCTMFGNLKVKFNTAELGMANVRYMKAQSLFGQKCKSLLPLFTSVSQAELNVSVRSEVYTQQEYEYRDSYGRNGRVYRRQIPICNTYKAQYSIATTDDITFEGRSFTFKRNDSRLIRSRYGLCW